MASNTIDYYQILGVSRDADTKAILKAYKKLALKHHPDRNRGNEEEASLKFQQVSEAAEILRDPEKRKMYNMYGVSKTKHLIPKNMDELFNMVFADDSFNTSHDKDNIIAQSKVQLSFKNCYYGTVLQKQIKYWYCTSCGAFGENITRCYKCNGSGTVSGQTCRNCCGTGKQCETINCANKRVSKSLTYVDISIPAGSRDGDTVRVIFNAEDHGKKIKGIVLFDIKCEQSKYEIKQNDLYLIQPVDISLSQALRGGDITIKHLNDLFIRPTYQIIQCDTYYKIPGRGMPLSNKRKYIGDLYVKFEIQMPPSRCLQNNSAKEIYKTLPHEQQDSNQGIEKVMLEDIEKHHVITMDQSTLNQHNSYSCKKCHNIIVGDLLHDWHKQLNIYGNTASLFQTAAANNIKCQDVIVKKLDSGNYKISWVYCAGCNTTLGLKYIELIHSNNIKKNQEKIGKYCLQLRLLATPKEKTGDVIGQTSVTLSLLQCYEGATKQIKFTYKHKKENCLFGCKKGKLIKSVKLQKVTFPPGLFEGDTFVYTYCNYQQKIAGNVLIKIHCQSNENDRYDVNGRNLCMKYPLQISLRQAIVGGKFTIKHFEEEIWVKPNFRIIRKDKDYKISGKGMGESGDLWIKFEIKMPNNDELDKEKIQQICNRLPKDTKCKVKCSIVQMEIPDEFDRLCFDDNDMSIDDLDANNEEAGDCKVQ